MTEALIDSLSPLTPQAIESDDSQIKSQSLGHGPEDFDNHGVNPRLHQAFAIDWKLEALLKEDNRNISSRASSQETFWQIMVEEQMFQGVSHTLA
jgi:hypothetical protein